MFFIFEIAINHHMHLNILIDLLSLLVRFLHHSSIHDNHALGFKTWNKCELTPIIKYIAIDILLNVLKRK